MSDQPALTTERMTEEQMREAEVPWPKSPEELSAYIARLVDQQHDYGTCVYAMSMAAVAAYNYVAHRLGVTGFQASCADMDFIRRTRGLTMGFRLMDYSKLLYPQYLTEEHFPTLPHLMVEHAKELAEAAQKKLDETGGVAHEDVLAHWKALASRKPS